MKRDYKKEFNFYLEPKLKEKLDLMNKRMSKKNKFDNWVLIDGDEGYGKSNMMALVAAYISFKTKRSLNVDNVFFNLDDLLTHAINTEAQIILWDEGALGGLSTEWWSKNQRKLIKLMMVARKRRHFFIICIPKFFKLNEYIVVDRSIGIIHVYARQETLRGRFCYYSKKRKEQLFYAWKRSRKRDYNKFKSFRGTFAEVLPKVFNEALYDEKKEKAILSINEDDKKSKTEEKLEWFKGKIMLLDRYTKKELAEIFELQERSIYNWSKKVEKLKDKDTEPQIELPVPLIIAHKS